MVKDAKIFIKKILRALFQIDCIKDHYFIKSLGKKPIIVDLGASKGEFISKILEIYPFSNAILIEPSPCSAEILNQRFGKKGNVHILRAAIGDKNEEGVKFYLSKSCELNSLDKSLSELGGAVAGGQSEITVRMIKLENIFSLFELERIDLLKIDIEGAELSILKNLTKYDFERIAQISVEFHDFLNPSLRKDTQSCIQNLQRLGYSFIHRGSDFMFGTPYFNCLFYDKKRIKNSVIPKWLNVDFLQRLVTLCRL